jgi:ubiquinone/menaquinone biosynthesis C-methylase UbiE
MTGDLTAYYAARAGEYDRIYLKPERQADLAGLRDTVSRFATGRHVLEVACGTGYWTEVMAPAAASLTGIDRVPEVLAAARARRLPPHARLLEADAFDLERVPGRFDAAFAGFWCSHLRRDEMTRFLAGLHRRLGRGARVMLLDNRNVAGSSTPIARTDDNGDTWQVRRLDDGREFEILKNHPAPGEVERRVREAGGAAVRVVEMEYYWHAVYETS